MVAPLIAAFEAAMIVKSLPVIPSRTSLIFVSLTFASKMAYAHLSVDEEVVCRAKLLIYIP